MSHNRDIPNIIIIGTGMPFLYYKKYHPMECQTIKIHNWIIIGTSLPLFIATNDIQCNQCDLKAKLFVQRLAVDNNKNLPKCAQNFAQILTKPSKNCLKALKFCQSGGIPPNLVTLNGIPVNQDVGTQRNYQRYVTFIATNIMPLNRDVPWCRRIVGKLIPGELVDLSLVKLHPVLVHAGAHHVGQLLLLDEAIAWKK